METLKKLLKDLRFRRKNEVPIFGSIEKIFLGKVGNFFEHQGRSKICSRIEWKHSQALKITLGHRIKKRTFWLHYLGKLVYQLSADAL